MTTETTPATPAELPADFGCRACTVRVECLNYALDNGEKFGVWGGTSERERRKLRKIRRRELLAAEMAQPDLQVVQ